MADHKPPRLAGAEGETVLALLAYQRDSLVRKVSGVDDEAARRSPVHSGTTLLWLVNHMADAESTWVLERFAGEEGPRGGGQPPATVAAAVDRYRATWARVDAVVAGAETLDERCRQAGNPPVNLRWVLMHLLGETARHAGHADILREMIDGQTGR